MKLKLYIFSIIALLSVACSKTIPELESDVPVNFSTFIDSQTKVDEYFTAGERLGLFGYNLNDGATWNNSFAPDFMYNVPLEYSGAEWFTNKPYYWSQNSYNSKRFYAYYPYVQGASNENIVLSPASHKGSPYIDFTVTDGMTDFITCGAQEGNVENPNIRFTAKHSLAKLSVGFATDIQQGMAYAKAVKVYGVLKNGRFTFDNATDENSGFVNGQDVINLDFAQPEGGYVYVDSPEAVYAKEYTMYLLPSGNSDGKGAIKQIETEINGIKQVFDLTSVPLIRGKNTSIKIIIDQKEVKFTATIEDWEVVDRGEIDIID